MKKSTKITLIVLGGLIILVGIVGITYAYFRTNGIQDNTNTFFTSGCLSITLSDYDENNSAITLNNAYPISDIEGLEEEGYSFTITNNCSTSTNYAINLESVGQNSDSTLNADYIKVSLSSDTVGNVISLLSSNNAATTEISGAYASHNLYTGTLAGEESKNYTLKLWIDYDATVEEAANKTYQSKINVIANPETAVIDNLEATFALSDKTLTANLTGGVTSANYCITTDNVCEPDTGAIISSNSYSVELGNVTKQVATVLGNLTVNTSDKQMVCTKLDGDSKVICSEPERIGAPNLAYTSCKNDCDEATVGIYEETTSSGTTYYYRGDVENNYLEFAGYTWRIIRINEDGSVRIIYDGEEAYENGDSSNGTARQIGTSYFNSSSSVYQYSYGVGYMYTANAQYGTTASSTIKGELDTWYLNNIVAKDLEDYLADSGFCGDRASYSDENGTEPFWSADRSYTLYYGAYVRIITNRTASLECSKDDLYTVENENGNTALTYPIGLITVDEVAYAGLGWDNSKGEIAYNTSFYLYTGSTYWTMSPSYFHSAGFAYVFGVSSSGHLYRNFVSNTSGVRPVINLKANVTISEGDGTAETPYVVE